MRGRIIIFMINDPKNKYSIASNCAHFCILMSGSSAWIWKIVQTQFHIRNRRTPKALHTKFHENCKKKKTVKLSRKKPVVFFDLRYETPLETISGRWKFAIRFPNISFVTFPHKKYTQDRCDLYNFSLTVVIPFSFNKDIIPHTHIYINARAVIYFISFTSNFTAPPHNVVNANKTRERNPSFFHPPYRETHGCISEILLSFFPSSWK